jgi:hypothetical protein
LQNNSSSQIPRELMSHNERGMMCDLTSVFNRPQYLHVCMF